jgi:hypothetical protein
MRTFTYSFIFKLIFRFGNIFVTALLLIYITPLVVLVDQQKLLLIPLIISLILIYIINKTYLTYYKIIPYKIEADDVKMICSNFLFSNKSFSIRYDDIEKLKGGVFEGKSSGLMKIRDKHNKVQIGFSHKIKDSGKLISLILSKVSKDQYNEVIDHITKRNKQRSIKTKKQK